MKAFSKLLEDALLQGCAHLEIFLKKDPFFLSNGGNLSFESTKRDAVVTLNLKLVSPRLMYNSAFPHFKKEVDKFKNRVTVNTEKTQNRNIRLCNNSDGTCSD